MNSSTLYSSVLRQKPASFVRQYSVPSKRAPQVATTRQRTQAIALCQPIVSNSKVPKFTMARSEFMTADLFARHRQLVETPHGCTMDALNRPRASFKTLGELAMCKGMGLEEANVPH
ncbi:hypothetical protein H4S02_010656, partial [Coemansia sp. RSA 2611]